MSCRGTQSKAASVKAHSLREGLSMQTPKPAKQYLQSCCNPAKLATKQGTPHVIHRKAIRRWKSRGLEELVWKVVPALAGEIVSLCESNQKPCKEQSLPISSSLSPRGGTHRAHRSLHSTMAKGRNVGVLQRKGFWSAGNRMHGMGMSGHPQQLGQSVHSPS